MKNKPVAVCTVCGEYTSRIEVINEQCHIRQGKKRCSGVFGSALNIDDWAECSRCKGSGCEACQGCGVMFVRKMR